MIMKQREIEARSTANSIDGFIVSSQVMAVCIVAVGCAVLVGWFFNIPTLQSILPNYVTMKANTAICFVLIGMALYMMNDKMLSSGARGALIDLSACLIVVAGLLTMGEYLFGVDLGIDELIIKDSPTAILTSEPGRMAFNTTINFLLIGAGLLMFRRGKKPLQYIAQILVLIAGMITLWAFTGYLYNANPLIVGLRFSTAMAIQTTVLFLLACISFLFARPRAGFMYIVSSNMSGSRMVRAIIPVAIVTPLLLGWLKVMSQKHGVFTDEMGVAFMAILSLSITSVFIYLFAILVNVKEEELRESEERYRAVSEYSNNAICIVNEQGKIIWCNTRMVAMGGYSREQIYASHSFAGYSAPESVEFVTTNFIKVARGEPYEHRYNFYFVRADGEKRLCEKYMMDYTDKYGRRNLIISMTDITDRVRLEEELLKAHKLDSLGVLAGGIAHDFNNILTGIVGNISVVRYGMDGNDPHLEILKEAEKAAFEAKNLAQQLLTFSKGGEPVKRPTVLTQLLNDSAVFATRGSRSKCTFKLDPDISLVNIDSGQISQVISNIVINAVQAMPDGGDIEISAENVQVMAGNTSVPLPPGGYIRIGIKDTGIGIPPTDLPKIFDPYFTTKPTGNGLGLATSYSIIKNHHGYISVDSKSGKGTSFTIYLPAFPGEADIAADDEHAEIKKGHGRILMMDDEEIIRVLGIRLLTQLGYAVESFPDSAQAVERYRQTWGTPEAFDAVILDMTIPGGEGGKETLLKLMEINPNVKAIVSSGYSADPVLANYRAFGFTSILPKPYEIEKISEVLFRVVMKGMN